MFKISHSFLRLVTTTLLLLLIAACGGSSSMEIESVPVTNSAPSGETQTNEPPTDNDNGSATMAGTTDGVLCEYVYNEFNDSDSVNMTSNADWSCDGTNRQLVANGIPDHDVGTFPNAGNPNRITEQSVSVSYTLTPQQSVSVTELGGPRGAVGHVINGVKIDADTAGTCNDDGSSCDLAGRTGNWSIEALGQSNFDFGTDDNNAHVQPDGAYHYHGIPEGFVSLRSNGDPEMVLIGWAVDGFPIYARYGYTDPDDASSEIKVVTGSYQLITDVSANRPSVEDFPLGIFKQDWVYVEGAGDLDECNGRVGVTPEFPEGVYHYYATDSYPYFQRCVKGTI